MKENKRLQAVLLGSLPLSFSALSLQEALYASGLLFSLYIVSLYFFTVTKPVFLKNFFRLAILIWCAAWALILQRLTNTPYFLAVSLVGLLAPVFFKKNAYEVSEYISTGAWASVLILLFAAARQIPQASLLFGQACGIFLIAAVGLLAIKKVNRL